MLKLLLVAAALAPQSQPGPSCLTPTDMDHLTLFSLPPILDAVAEKCRAVLPADAYLLTGARTLSQRLASEGSSHWEGALAALEKAGGQNVPEGLSLETGRHLMADLARSKIVKKMNPTSCTDINEAAELLSPLPTENLTGIVRLLLRLGGKNDESAPKICSVETR